MLRIADALSERYAAASSALASAKAGSMAEGLLEIGDCSTPALGCVEARFITSPQKQAIRFGINIL